ncbi:MAG: C69 family dipeptidase [Elusimicrobiota bacterium]|nr:C69 family dipeptidase [Elusimicrobiota bacterium]
MRHIANNDRKYDKINANEFNLFHHRRKYMSIARLLFCVCMFSAVFYNYIFAGTTMIITKEASADGSIMVASSDDGNLSDASIVFVPAKDWDKGSMRTVYASAAAIGDMPQHNAFLMPRISDKNRAPAYEHIGVKRTKAIGYIPQVEHTYAYLDGNYGIINEHGLMFGECSNPALIVNEPELGKRIFYASELSRVALERAKTARQAIQIIGELIETYGYYGTGETLTVADSNEAWVIEMAPSPENRGGLWAAQKVPDGHFFIAAEEFRIREITADNPDQMYSKNLFEIAQKYKIRKPEDTNQDMDWLLTVGKGEYNHPYYSLRRIWRAFSLIAPSLNFSPYVLDAFTKNYPFSIKPDKKISLDKIKELYRDHYEGTEFDLTKGAAAGAWENPNRYLGTYDPRGDREQNMKITGAWENPIANSYTGYVYINQNKPNIAAGLNIVSWIALNAPSESVFVPLTVNELPISYYRGNPSIYESNSAYWVYNIVASFANIKYNYILKDIQMRADMYEKNSERIISAAVKELALISKENPQKAALEFSKVLNKNALTILGEWRNFFFELIVKSNQGYINTLQEMSQRVGSPQEWLDQTDYKNGPINYGTKRQ